jgi:hypothetical protein
MGPRAVLGAVVKRRIPSFRRRESTPRALIVQLVAERYTVPKNHKNPLPLAKNELSFSISVSRPLTAWLGFDYL